MCSAGSTRQKYTRHTRGQAQAEKLVLIVDWDLPDMIPDFHLSKRDACVVS